mmetsp:Transcript_10196/g.17739  ORF Transcript_10196/g.17739 Transcript_10196/m.17739 type:complete len:98 (+) Transcript_10196:3-296(+)
MPSSAGGDLPPGTPTEREMLELYFHRRKEQAPSSKTWSFFLALSWFRKAAIAHGVFARSLQGNASSSKAEHFGVVFCASVELCLSFLGSPLVPAARL